MSTSHLDRKELKRPDAFLEKASDLVSFFNENGKAVSIILGALFIIGLGTAFYANARSKKTVEAESALYKAKHELELALGKTSTPAEAAKQAEAAKAAANGDWETKSKSAIEKLEKAAKDYKGTSSGFQAYLILGDIYSDHKDSKKAEHYYKEAVGAAPSKAMKAVGLHSLAYSQEDLKNYDGAIETLRQTIGQADSSIKADVLMSLARNYELKGDKTKALEQYELVTKEFPNSAVAKTAESQKTRLR